MDNSSHDMTPRCRGAAVVIGRGKGSGQGQVQAQRQGLGQGQELGQRQGLGQQVQGQGQSQGQGHWQGLGQGQGPGHGQVQAQWQAQGQGHAQGLGLGQSQGLARWLVTMLALMIGLVGLLPRVAAAQEFGGLARLDVMASGVRDSEAGLELTLYLSQAVPYRAYTLGAPPRLVLDFREVDWRGATPAALLAATRATGLRFGAIRPGWSRMVVDLAGPYALETAGLVVDSLTGTARLDVRLEPVDPAAFAARSGAPPGAEWDIAPPPAPVMPPADDGPLMVVVDPGHGGIDPGAIRGDLTEAALMLTIAVELADAINRSGTMRAVLTRDSDIFVPLAQRMTIARAARADVLISLHADALEMDAAQGASVYTLSGAALDQASARMAERHERGDLLAGLDLSGQDDTVATVLMDLARLETAPQSLRLADALVAGLQTSGAALNGRPRREGPLAVLNAADFPSVLVEVGFLSSQQDRDRLTSPQGRAPIVAGILAALQTWAADESARRTLNRQ